LTTIFNSPTIVGGSIVRTTVFLSVMNLKEKFGLKIRSLRESKGYSMEYLANVSNIDRNYISDIEKGTRNVSLLIIEKLAKAFEVNIKDLFDYEE
jgi:DNA-binding XRE family transcriptional regulator